MNRRSFLKVAAAGALYNPSGSTKHVIFIVNGGGARKRDYYEDATLAPNVRRIARQGFVFEEDHCPTVSSHDSAFAELFGDLRYQYVDALGLIPGVMSKSRPRLLVCRELRHDVGHSGYEHYLRAVRMTDDRIGAIFDWVRNEPEFSNNTAIIIRPEFGRDDEVNPHGELHHSYGYYYTHRVASIFWGPDFNKGVDKKTVITASDMAPRLRRLFRGE